MRLRRRLLFRRTLLGLAAAACVGAPLPGRAVELPDNLPFARPVPQSVPAPRLPGAAAPGPNGARPQAPLPARGGDGFYATPVVAEENLRSATVPSNADYRPWADFDTGFPRPPVLQPVISFWTRVYSEFSENQSVIHSSRDYSRVLAVVDLRGAKETMEPGAFGAFRARQEAAAKARVEYLLHRADELKDTPEAMDADERAIFDLYADSQDPDRFRSAFGTARVQRGRREVTMRSLERSGRYMPQIEAVFKSYGLPLELTNLPFIESAFVEGAYSRSKAAGIWQFIPSSGKMYMRVNDLVDDRRDPWASTDAAARHLRDDYRALGSWDLAVTAYNFGRGGIAKALRQVGGANLGDLIDGYRSTRFGFDSRNYYAMFIAMSDVARDFDKHFAGAVRRPPMEFDLVQTRHYVPYDTLRRLSGADAETFGILNPTFRTPIVEGSLYVPPANTIRVPKGNGAAFEAAYGQLGSNELFDHQRTVYAMHRVGRGETLASLARRFNLPVERLAGLNGLYADARLKNGMRVKVPTSRLPAGADIPDADIQTLAPREDVMLAEAAPGAVPDADGTPPAEVRPLSDAGSRTRVRLKTESEVQPSAETAGPAGEAYEQVIQTAQRDEPVQSGRHARRERVAKDAPAERRGRAPERDDEPVRPATDRHRGHGRDHESRDRDERPVLASRDRSAGSRGHDRGRDRDEERAGEAAPRGRAHLVGDRDEKPGRHAGGHERAEREDRVRDDDRPAKGARAEHKSAGAHSRPVKDDNEAHPVREHGPAAKKGHKK